MEAGIDVFRPHAAGAYMEESHALCCARVNRYTGLLHVCSRCVREHTWRSPVYRFTRAQQRAWDVLIEEAGRVVAMDTGRERSHGNDGEEEEEEGEDEVEGEDVVMEEGGESDVEEDADNDETNNTDTNKPKPD